MSLAKLDEADHPTMKQKPSTSTEALFAGEALRVLLVDDHPMVREGLIRLISGQPAIQVVGEASDGREALEKVQHLRPSLVLMDVSMPVMDGIEATRHIRAEWPEVRVIGLSMYEDEHIAQKMYDAGAEAFVTKTASPTALLKTIYGSAQ